MKLNCGRSYQRRRHDAHLHFCNWHRWYAWRPVRIGENDCRWLEWVERKADYVHEAGLIFEFSPGECKYRAIEAAA